MYKQGTWKLSELAPDHKSPEFAKQVTRLESKVKNFGKIKPSLGLPFHQKSFSESYTI